CHRDGDTRNSVSLPKILYDGLMVTRIHFSDLIVSEPPRSSRQTIKSVNTDADAKSLAWISLNPSVRKPDGTKPLD
ncbi:MAG: hypothetical protein AAFN70_19440, partial [Planctomycetota bacterium]